MAEIYANKIREVQISVDSLSVSYGDTRVLEDVNLEIYKGEFVGLVGSSGSGKTTLLNSLAGFIPAGGEIRIPGKVGVVFQDYSVFPWMTVSENIVFGLQGGAWDDDVEVLHRHLKLIRLEDRADKYPAELSGGQIQRVGIARALAANPSIILMDEPYGALDRDTRDRMQTWLLDVWSQDHKTIVFITHDIEEAIFLSDRVLILDDKKICKEYIIPFERPRTENIKSTPEFLTLKKEIFSIMRHDT